jgi:regulator of PEP synthase PpsR (kinase-PPPase family)
MNVYRGPESKPFWDDSHEFVSQIKPEELKEGIESDALIQFNISKNATERQAVCTARFEDEDMIPMISGLLSRLNKEQKRLTRIKEIMNDTTTNYDQKINAIRATLSKDNG